MVTSQLRGVSVKDILILSSCERGELFGPCVTKAFKIVHLTVVLLGIYVKEASEIIQTRPHRVLRTGLLSSVRAVSSLVLRSGW